MTENSDTSRNRTLDLVRGFAVFLAIGGHFSTYLAAWYFDYFGPSKTFNGLQDHSAVELYQFHSEYFYKFIYPDQMTIMISFILSPWVTALFAAFIGYNFSRKPRKWLQKNRQAGALRTLVLFLIFFSENMLVSENFGRGISMFETSTWMLLLLTLWLLDSFFELWHWALLLLISIILLQLDVSQKVNLKFFELIAHQIHPWTTPCAELIQFLPATLLGLILGRLLFSSKTKSICTHEQIKRTTLILLAASGVLGVLIVRGHPFHFDAQGIERFASYFDRSIYSNFFILTLSAAIILAIHQAQHLKLHSAFNYLEWVGRHSIGIFLIHRIVFLKVLAPIRLHIGSYFSIPMTNSAWEVIAYSFLVTVIYRILQKNQFFGSLISRA